MGGITVGVIYDFAGIEMARFPASQDVVCIDYEANPDTGPFSGQKVQPGLHYLPTNGNR